MFVHSRTPRNIGFALLFSSSLAAFWTPLNTLIRFSLQHDHYSHILLVPIVSLSLLVLERRRIFAQVETCWGLGSGLILAGVLLYSFGLSHPFSWSENDQLSLAISSLVTIWVGGFILCYGPRAFRLGLLP